MSDHSEHLEQTEAVERGSADATGVQTGHPAVDDVLASLHGLDERPLGEHVTVFEAAHEALRAVLSDAGRTTDRPVGG